MATPPDHPPSALEDSIDFASPRSPGELSDSDDESPAGSPSPETSNTLRLPSLRSTSNPQNTPSMNPSSTPLGLLQNARRPNLPPSSLSSMRGPQRNTGGALPESMEAKMRAFHLSRQGTPPSRPQMGAQSVSVGSGPIGGQPNIGGGAIAGLPPGLRLPPNLARPQAHNFVSAPAVPKMSLSDRRKMKLPGGLPGADSSTPNLGTNGNAAPPSNQSGNAFDQFSKYVDTKKGELRFPDKAIISSQGVEFSSGSTFSISLDEVDTLDELGKGNYGTVYKVRHSRPRMRRPGLGLAGNKLSSFAPITPSPEKDLSLDSSPKSGGGTGVIMAMKELRLELDEAKFAAIIMELDILHRCLSPYIIDFYGAFFQEGAVYICIEFMDGGSIDKLYGDGIPENVLKKITYATTQGLKTLKDDHNIIHRDVKPTNILVNTKGQVKICDFGVSGNLVASIAKTNIGCQSYMAPERISGGGMSQAGANPGGGTYSVQSDIWSLGLTIIECALGRYPYPPETYNNIFSQLSAIVDGEPPDLPAEGYSAAARDFVKGCLNKIPKLRPTYGALLAHPWLLELSKPVTISEEDEEMAEVNAETTYTGGVGDHKVMGAGRGTEDAEVAEWVKNAIERKKNGLMGESKKPALHAAPLDTVSPAASPSI
ncbi:BOS5, mitogen-activated protein kinase [Mollisia scopiformis]|uniref:mitogen-activated protein kinase kinase n=1 Tax=Mollisia scopiformis TaxID=149040 RepID=A0A194XU85_MOLSC|nr:BOS5, mitogen-activated protein kinase [Mollisia scopiformis]KUJ23599.1 BOS5, mitogen-activated protein kinase [Mollisia scopiformis]